MDEEATAETSDLSKEEFSKFEVYLDTFVTDGSAFSGDTLVDKIYADENKMPESPEKRQLGVVLRGRSAAGGNSGVRPAREYPKSRRSKCYYKLP